MARLPSGVNLCTSVESVNTGIYTASGSKEVLPSKQSVPYFVLTQVNAWMGRREAGHPDRAGSTVSTTIILCFCSTTQTIIAGSPTVLLPLLMYHLCDTQPGGEARGPELLWPSAPAYSIAQKVKIGLE